tara:strand:- start:108 stop:554 length:447 start_codon:yes stop_codon:yes gene_type:complete
MERGPEQHRGLLMTKLLYRGKIYDSGHATEKVCKQLNYRGHSYNTCSEYQKSNLHPKLSYRGIGYNKSFETAEECRIRNDRQSYFSLTRELVRAQFQLGDASRTAELWQEVANRGLDVDRITHLMYGCHFQDDDETMLFADKEYQSKH